MLILGVDSSAKAISCAVKKDDVLLGEIYQNNGLTHSQTLLPMVESLLKDLSIDCKDIDLFAVNCGPGSFTGIRIGVSAIKAIAYAYCKPCCAVSTLQSLALNALPHKGVICAVMDARCKQVYNALFLCDSHKISRLCSDRAIGIEQLFNEIKSIENDIILVGDGATLCYNVFKQLENVSIMQQNNLFARASSVCQAAQELFLLGEHKSAKDLIPYYLRPSQAERELKKRNME